MEKSLRDRLTILSDAAKYDASCASSGSKRTGGRAEGVGSTESTGICHTWTPDGRCVSLLKILLTNFCTHDCAYCINRSSSNVERARFKPEEVIWLTLEFYRRNFIEGLFLSSGIIQSADYTMEHLVRVARELRLVHNFYGYIHLKTIPDASPHLIKEAGLFADRLSINIELPTDRSLLALAPEKRPQTIRQTMNDLRQQIEEACEPTMQSKRRKRFAPGGQSTQMIIGADDANDATILKTSARLYTGYHLKRVYYSAFSPIPDASSRLPLVHPPLLREHRLYQADWLYRYYSFSIEEITDDQSGGMLSLEMDPKLSWALMHRGRFPIDINKAEREMLLRVPGFGVRTVERILATRRYRQLRIDDLARLRLPINKARPFITAVGWTPGGLIDGERLDALFRPQAQQLNLF